MAAERAPVTAHERIREPNLGRCSYEQELNCPPLEGTDPSELLRSLPRTRLTPETVRAEVSAKRWRELTESDQAIRAALASTCRNTHAERHGRGSDSLRFHVLWLTRERRPEIRGAAVCVDCESNREVSQRLPTMTRNFIGRVAPAKEQVLGSSPSVSAPSGLRKAAL